MEMNGHDSVEEGSLDGQEQEPSLASDSQGDTLESLRAEKDALQEKYLRQAAEYQNYRRRTEAEMIGRVEIGKRVVLERMLTVLDDLDRSMEAVSESDGPEALSILKDGVELVHRRFLEEMKALGVEPIEAVGELFDENEHEALLPQPAPEGVEPGTVVAEFQKGYRLGGRVLRHSRVAVAY